MYLTSFTSSYIYNVRNYSLFFGDYKKKETIKFEAGVVTEVKYYFSYGDIFAIDLWEKGRYGTSSWYFYILMASSPDTSQNTVSRVKPSAEILLKTKTQHFSKKIVFQLNNLRSKNVDLPNQNADFFRKLAFNLRERKRI